MTNQDLLFCSQEGVIFLKHAVKKNPKTSTEEFSPEGEQLIEWTNFLKAPSSLQWTRSRNVTQQVFVFRLHLMICLKGMWSDGQNFQDKTHLFSFHKLKSHTTATWASTWTSGILQALTPWTRYYELCLFCFSMKQMACYCSTFLLSETNICFTIRQNYNYCNDF